MRHGIVQPIDWGLLGATLANEGSEEQIAFFKAFVGECFTWGTTYQVQKQLVYVNEKLTEQEKEALSMLSCKGEA